MRTAVVTGAGRGIGRAVAQRLSADGFFVAAVDIDLQGARATAQLVSGSAHHCDVAHAAAVEELAEEVEPVEALVNNAGIWRYGSVLRATRSDLERVLRVNLLGTLNCCRAFAPGMATAGGGAMVNLSSASAAMGAAGLGVYPASKAAIDVLTRQLAGQLGPMGIRVNAVAPGLIPTTDSPDERRDSQAHRVRTVPLGRMGSPADVAKVVSFLVGGQSGYVTGQVIAVDGGMTAGRSIS